MVTGRRPRRAPDVRTVGQASGTFAPGKNIRRDATYRGPWAQENQVAGFVRTDTGGAAARQPQVPRGISIATQCIDLGSGGFERSKSRQLVHCRAQIGYRWGIVGFNGLAEVLPGLPQMTWCVLVDCLAQSANSPFRGGLRHRCFLRSVFSINVVYSAAQPGSQCVLVAGGSGFVGRHLVSSLAAAGYKLSCIVRRASERR